MPNRNVSFYGNLNQPLGGSSIQRDYAIDPRRQMAQNLMQQGSSTAPVQSPLEGLARALTAGVGGYFGGEANREMRDREALSAQQMQQILAGGQANEGTHGAHGQDSSPGGYQGMINAAQGVNDLDPSLQPMVQQLMTGKMDKEAALEEYNRKRADEMADAERLLQLKQQYPSANSPTGRPSSPIQNFAERQRLVGEHGENSPEVNRFDNYVRATQLQNIGPSIVAYNPANPSNPTTVAQTGLKPGEEPSVRGEQAAASAEGAVLGKEQGTAGASLKAAEAALPRLEEAVKKLSDLGKSATYTQAGQAKDYISRQAGLEPSEGAVSRAKYIAHVKNNVLPLLRTTFGAAFTVAEGDSLLATLGDPDMSPGEKDAVLDAFISDKKAEIGTLQRQTGTTTDLKSKYGLE
jgi:hypothetical protein